MKEGAVAVIDALGFRGIWERWPPEKVLANMYSLKQHLDSSIKAIATQPNIQFEATFPSDTIVIGLSLPADEPNHAALSIVYVADLVTQILAWSARSSTPLTYRGVIGYGAYVISPHFIMGQAIDEAAAHHETAQGAIVWLLPGAKNLVADWLKGQPLNTHMVTYGVPVKGGGVVETYTVSPIVQTAGPEGAKHVAAKLLATFAGTRPDIPVKRQTTLHHLRACFAWRGWNWPQELDVYH